MPPRIRDLWQYQETFTAEDFRLLGFGRHYRFPDGAKAVFGRNEEENTALRRFAVVKRAEDAVVVEALSFPAPAGLVLNPSGGSGDSPGRRIDPNDGPSRRRPGDFLGYASERHGFGGRLGGGSVLRRADAAVAGRKITGGTDRPAIGVLKTQEASRAEYQTSTR